MKTLVSCVCDRVSIVSLFVYHTHTLTPKNRGAHTLALAHSRRIRRSHVEGTECATWANSSSKQQQQQQHSNNKQHCNQSEAPAKQQRWSVDLLSDERGPQTVASSTLPHYSCCVRATTTTQFTIFFSQFTTRTILPCAQCICVPARVNEIVCEWNFVYRTSDTIVRRAQPAVVTHSIVSSSFCFVFFFVLFRFHNVLTESIEECIRINWTSAISDNIRVWSICVMKIF